MRLGVRGRDMRRRPRVRLFRRDFGGGLGVGGRSSPDEMESSADTRFLEGGGVTLTHSRSSGRLSLRGGGWMTTSG